MMLSEQEQFCRYLIDLCYIPSVYVDPINVEKAMLYCETVLRNNLKNYSFVRDDLNNLICLPNEIDSSINILYLSAHVDTVSANPEEWSPPFSPFIPFENEQQIVARGVSDCKAGVAFQLLLSSMMYQGLITIKNIVFTLTFKEEGAGEKTSPEIARHLGGKYPLSTWGDYILVLENTVLASPEPILQYYTSERGSFTIRVEGTISALQHHLNQLNNWNPVYITPLKDNIKSNNERQINQTGGHACTVERNHNILNTIILSADHRAVIQTEGKIDIAIIPTKILIGEGEREEMHSMILNNRSFISKDQILQQLKDISYTSLNRFELSSGMNIQKQFQSSPLSSLIQKLNHRFMKMEEAFNPGASDASLIYNSCDYKIQACIFPLVIGPGTRSQKQLSPPRLTHGVNETFDKSSGIKAIQTLLDFLHLTGHLANNHGMN